MTELDEQIARGLSIIKQRDLNGPEQDQLMNDTIVKWKRFINDGFLKYRKSVSYQSTYALLDWYDAYPGTPWFNDHRGVRYLDLLGGYGIYNVGRRHPDVINAVVTQLGKQALHSQELLDPLRAQCAHILSLIMPSTLKNFFFTNSGTESVEACLKMAFLATGRNTVIACLNGFHGKTIGSLSCTSKSVFRGPFLASLNRTFHTPFNDVESLTTLFRNLHATGEQVAAVLIEPIQGEGGIHVATAEFLKSARELCDRYGTILIFDEVQSGMGRSGKWWAFEHTSVVPDLMAIGKAFGGGVVPAGACVGNDKVWSKFVNDPFLFTTTFGGNPLAMAAAISTIAVIHRENLCGKAAEKGEYFLTGLRTLAKAFPSVIKEIRGRGLMLGIEFYENDDGIEFSKRMLDRHILVAGTLSYAKTIRIEPALTICNEDIDHSLAVMNSVVHDIETGRKPISKL